MKLVIIDTAYHRNGVSGAPLHVVLFHDGKSRKVAILFEQEAHCAVLDVAKLAAGDIAFGSNSWRGDLYEPALRQAITANRDAAKADGQDESTAEDRGLTLTWSVEDVLEVRPDLTAAQALEVLKLVEEQHNATLGVTWDTLEDAAHDLFGDAPETGEA